MDNNIDKEIWFVIKGLKEEFLQSGYDFFPLLLRYPLSSVLGRAKRLELDTDTEKVFEYQSLLELQFGKTLQFSKKKMVNNKRPLLWRRLINKIKAQFRKNINIHKNSIFIPIYSDRIENVCKKLSEGHFLIIGEKENPANFRHLFSSYHVEVKKYKVDKNKVLSVYNRLETYIKNNGFTLDAYSTVYLHNAVLNIFRDIQYVKGIYEQYSPKLILLFKDSYSPCQVFSLLSKKYKTKVILLQHGLDCENYFLDDVYTENVILWGDYRRDRYKKDSEYQPKYSVLGNPNYSHIKRVPIKKSSIKKWLFITRPHHSKFCYSYSRKVNEGLDILIALSKLLKVFNSELIIKPHKNDYVNLYQNFIKSNNINNIRISSGVLADDLENADLVISEDSSAVIDAMLHGKLIILVHFADSKPSLPVEAFDVTPIARNKKELGDCINNIITLNETDLKIIQDKQDEFIHYCVGSVNNNSTSKTVSEIDKIINS